MNGHYSTAISEDTATLPSPTGRLCGDPSALMVAQKQGNSHDCLPFTLQHASRYMRQKMEI